MLNSFALIISINLCLPIIKLLIHYSKTVRDDVYANPIELRFEGLNRVSVRFEIKPKLRYNELYGDSVRTIG